MNPEVQQDGTQLVPLRSTEAYPTVPLSTLTEFATQKMYTELQRIIELLPMRTDVEKKVKLLDFLQGSRVLFIRLLALVRWETSANKVEKCKRILQVLETQSGLLLQTADTLATLSRETLQRARLPAFYLPAAIDVLTMRTYPRLPTIIRDRLTRPAPLTVRERRELATALNGLIQRRLLREALPLAMRTFEVVDGRVILTVAREFSIEATLFEHAVRPDTQPQAEDTAALGCVWRLLKLRILVVDCDSQPTRGRGTRTTRSQADSKLKASANVNALVSTTKPRANWTSPLVHALQVGYLLETAQRYIADKRQPLVSLFECLHSFCISLQLEVLHAQTARLAQTVGSPFAVQPNRDSLRISFWHDRVAVVASIQHCQVATNGAAAGESSAVHAFSSLVVSHEPPLADPMANARIQNALANEDALSIERVLVLTMHTRVVERFKVLQREIRRLVNGACELRGVGEPGVDGSSLRPATLCVPIVARCCSNEQLRIGIDIYTNEVHLACAALRTNVRGMQLLAELERLLGTIDADCNKTQASSGSTSTSTISETMKQVATILGELRLLIALTRCEASLTFVSGAQPRFVTESELALRFGTPTGDAVRALLDRRVAPRSASRALVAVPHHDAAFLVVAPLEVTARKTVAFDFYLLHIGNTMPTLLKVDHGAFSSALAADRQHTTSRTTPESIIDAHSEEQLAQMTTAILGSNSDSAVRARPTLPNSFAQTQLARRLDRKRRLLLCVSEPTASKRPRQSIDLDPDADLEEREWRIVPDLTSLLDFSSERLSFLLLTLQLQKQGMCIDRVTFDSESGKCSVNVLTFPQTDAGGELDCRVVECTIRRAGASSGWIFTARIDMRELLAPLAPLASSVNSLSSVLAINELYEFLPTEASVAGTVQRLAADWRNVACMFALIRRISAECQSDPDRCAFLRSFLVLEKCTLRSLVFSYSSTVGTLRRGTGANQLGELLCMIQCTELKSRGAYSLHFSRRRPSSSLADSRFANPHCLASSSLESLLNSTLSLTELCVAMRTNLQVLKTLNTLDYRLSAGFISGRQNALLTDFSLVVVSPLEFILVYKNTFSIEIALSAAKPNAVMLRERNRGAHETAQMPFDCLYLFKYFVSRLAEASRAVSDAEVAMPPASLSTPNRQLSAQTTSPSPVVVSVDVFARLFTPVRLPTTVDGSSGFTYPLLEAHCGCALLFRQFQRTLTSSGDESGNVWKQCEVKSILNESAIQLDFASDQVVGSLILRFTDDHVPTLQLRIPPSTRPPTAADQKPMLGNEHTQALERYFELRIIPQFKPQAVITFVRLLGMPSRFLRDAAQLLRYELAQALLHPQTTGGSRNSGPAHNLLSWCTCVPPGLQPAMPAPGATALAHLTTQNRPRIVSFWQFRRVVHPSQLGTIPPAELEQHYEPVAGFYVDRKALTVPLIYDIGNGMLNISPNSLQMQTPASNANATILQRVQAHLTRFQQAHNAPQQQLESPLFNALYDLAMYFTI